MTQVTLNNGSVDSAGSLKLRTNGTTDALILDTAQNVGVGVTPSAWSSTYFKALQLNTQGAYVSGANASYSGTPYFFIGNNGYDDTGGGFKYTTTNATAQYVQVGASHQWKIANSGTAGTAISFTQAMTLDASGRLIVGKTSGASRLSLGNNNVSTANTDIELTNDASVSNYVFTGGSAHTTTRWRNNLVLYTGGAQDILFETNATERARIDSSGNLLVGTTSNPQTTKLALQYGGTNVWGLGPNSGSATFYVLNSAGTGVYLSSGSTSWAATSDERVKDIIEPIINAANKVSTLRAVIGKYKTDEEGTRRSFLIAQDVQAVLPEAVCVQDDELQTLGVQYTDVIPLLVAAIKELKAEIDVLKGTK